MLHVGPKARILIAGQAPGTKVHASGRSFDDASGKRLRDWLGIDAETFYDAERISIAAMGFCFPGQDAKGGDLPPRRECASLWHDRLFAARKPFELVVAVGAASQAYHLKRLGLERFAAGGLTERVERWREIWEARRRRGFVPLPHPPGATPAGSSAIPGSRPSWCRCCGPRWRSCWDDGWRPACFEAGLRPAPQHDEDTRNTLILRCERSEPRRMLALRPQRDISRCRFSRRSSTSQTRRTTSTMSRYSTAAQR